MNSGSLSEKKITQLSSRVFVSAQITADDLSIIAAQGFMSVINNRPDGEVEGQPKSADLEATATKLGMAFVHVPVVHGSITSQNVADFEHVCEKLESPILLFCRSGARSTALWRLSAGR